MRTTIRKRKKRLPRGMKGTGIVLLLLLIGGIWQDVMVKRESRMLLPPGERFSIQSRDMHLYRAGQGDLTIVFAAGSGTPSAYTDFYNLQRELRRVTGTISYDRAGYGWSAANGSPRTIDNVVEELHDLLKAAKSSAPYMLVGHSLASLEVIRFAQKYPDEVKAVVLLDGGSPEYYASGIETGSYLVNRLTAGLRVTGIARALGSIGIRLPFAGEDLRYERLPDEVKPIDLAMYYRHLGDGSNLDSIRRMRENAQTVLDGGYLTDILLLILSSDTGSQWENVQRQLVRWSNVSRHVTIPDSRHYIHWSNQEEVLQRITEALHAARTGSWAK